MYFFVNKCRFLPYNKLPNYFQKELCISHSYSNMTIPVVLHPHLELQSFILVISTCVKMYIIVVLSFLLAPLRVHVVNVSSLMSVDSYILHIFVLGHLSYWIIKIHYIFWVYDLCKMCVLKIFFFQYIACIFIFLWHLKRTF